MEQIEKLGIETLDEDEFIEKIQSAGGAKHAVDDDDEDQKPAEAKKRKT